VNSSFFLWVVSALFLTAGGWYLTKYQQCAKHSDEAVENLKKVSEEYSGSSRHYRPVCLAWLNVRQIRLRRSVATLNA
jgi:hypothetical protein